LGAGSPFGGTDLVAVFGHKLGRRYPAENLIRVAPHIARDNFIGHDSAFGVEYEISPVGQALLFIPLFSFFLIRGIFPGPTPGRIIQ
jgi:hypothetical protein